MTMTITINLEEKEKMLGETCCPKNHIGGEERNRAGTWLSIKGVEERR